MGRFRSSGGPLGLAAATGPRAALLSFDVDGPGGGDLRGDLAGFILRREQLHDAGRLGPPTWIGGPPPRRRAPHREPEGAEESSGEGAPAGGPACGGGWRQAMQQAIQDFKWCDYDLEPGAQYRYTLCAVCGGAGRGPGAPEDDGDEPPADGPGPHAGARVSLLVATPPLHGGGGHEVHFNRGFTGQEFVHRFPGTQESTSRKPDEWRWLSRGFEEALLHFLEAAPGRGWQIRGALYEAHYMPVLRALAQARERGVDVALVVDWKMGAWSEAKKTWTERGPQHLNHWALHAAGLAAGCVRHRTRPVSAISHNKFFVLVAPGGDAVAVWTGSTNMTAGAIFGHWNVGHVIRDPVACGKYLQYWEKLQDDPEKADMAAFNEELSPLPAAKDLGAGVDADSGGVTGQDTVVLFSPRLQWASTLDFLAQLVCNAKQCIAFTAAFGISKELAPALLGNKSALKYILLENEGNWDSARETVCELRSQSNARVVLGTHMENVPTGTDSDWLPETLTGLNAHVKYIHTKILLVDPFSEAPIIVSGSANFSRASMETNDENIVVVHGNKDVADAYAVEFFRVFEHMRHCNRLQAEMVESRERHLCRCGEPASRFVCRKPGPNEGRPFHCCPKPRDQRCGFFQWLSTPGSLPGEAASQWPGFAFDGSSFACRERGLLATLGLEVGTVISIP